MAKFFIFISPVMSHDFIQLLKLHTAIFSSVLAGPVVFPEMYKILKDEVLQEALSVLLHLGKKMVFFRFVFLTTHSIC